MNVSVKTPEIKHVQFVGNSAMLLSLTNDRTLIVPLDKFKAIGALSASEKCDFEVIDGENLSFLALDEIYNIHDLIGDGMLRPQGRQ